MKQPLFLLLAILTKAAVLTALAVLTNFAASAQQPGGPRPGNYTADSFRLRVPGQRISLYAFCTPWSEGRAVYFRKDQDEAIHRVNFQNLSVALADNPASMRELHIAGTNIGIGIGLAAAGLALATAGIITTVSHNHSLSSAYDQASAKWYEEAQTNPNTPLPALPHYSGPGALFYLGAAATFSCMIPLFNVANHTRKAVDLYNGVH